MPESLTEVEIKNILGIGAKEPCPICSTSDWNLYHNEGCPKDKYICCNSDCDWKGIREECVTFKHDPTYLMCPKCNEAVEHYD